MSSFFSSQDGMLLAFGTLAHILQHGISHVGYDMPSELVLIGGEEEKKKICAAANTNTAHPD